jgi:hypothetical protein
MFMCAVIRILRVFRLTARNITQPIPPQLLSTNPNVNVKYACIARAYNLLYVLMHITVLVKQWLFVSGLDDAD